MKFINTCLMLLISGFVTVAHNDDYEGAGVLVRPQPSSKNTSIFAPSYDKEHLLKTVPKFVNVHKGDYYAYTHPDYSNKFREMAKSRAKDEKPATIYRVNHMLNSLGQLPIKNKISNTSKSVSPNVNENVKYLGKFKPFYGIATDPNDMFTKLDNFNKPRLTYKINRNQYDPQRLVNKLNAEERHDTSDPSQLFALLNNPNKNEEPIATVEKKEDKSWERLIGKKYEYSYLTKQEDHAKDSCDKETKISKNPEEKKDEKESTLDSDCDEETTTRYEKPNKSKDDDGFECDEETTTQKTKTKTAKDKQNEHELDGEEEPKHKYNEEGEEKCENENETTTSKTTNAEEDEKCENETTKSKTTKTKEKEKENENDMTDFECDEETTTKKTKSKEENKEIEVHTTEMVCDKEITTKRSRIDDDEHETEIECDDESTTAPTKDHKDVDECEKKKTVTAKTTLEKTTKTTKTPTTTKTPSTKSQGFSLTRLMPFGLKAYKQNNNNNNNNDNNNDKNKNTQSEKVTKKKKNKLAKQEKTKDTDKLTKSEKNNKHAMTKKKKPKSEHEDELDDQIELNKLRNLRNLCKKHTNFWLKGEKLQRTCTEHDFNECPIMPDPIASLLHSWQIKAACDKEEAQHNVHCPKQQPAHGKVKQCQFNQTTCDHTLTLLREFKRNAVHVLLNANDLETRLRARIQKMANLLQVVQGQCVLDQSTPTKAFKDSF